MKNDFTPNKNFNYNDAGGFSSYDPEGFEDDFDPDQLDGSTASAAVKTIMRKKEATFDLVMTNTSASALTVELFNYLRSYTRKRRADFATATFLYQPLESLEGSQKVGIGIVGFNQDGDLVITGGSAVAGVAPANFVFGANGGVKVSCPQFPYKSLCESSSLVPFKITKIRQTTVTDEQIDQPIVWFANSFLGGNRENTYNPRTYFRPDQFQGKIVDIPFDNFIIDGEKGVRYIVNADESVKWNITVAQYRKMTVR